MDTWDSYVAKYGRNPSSPSELVSFSRRSGTTSSSLSYTTAKSLFSKRKSHQRTSVPSRGRPTGRAPTKTLPALPTANRMEAREAPQKTEGRRGRPKITRQTDNGAEPIPSPLSSLRHETPKMYPPTAAERRESLRLQMSTTDPVQEPSSPPVAMRYRKLPGASLRDPYSSRDASYSSLSSISSPSKGYANSTASSNISVTVTSPVSSTSESPGPHYSEEDKDDFSDLSGAGHRSRKSVESSRRRDGYSESPNRRADYSSDDRSTHDEEEKAFHMETTPQGPELIENYIPSPRQRGSTLKQQNVHVPPPPPRRPSDLSRHAPEEKRRTSKHRIPPRPSLADVSKNAEALVVHHPRKTKSKTWDGTYEDRRSSRARPTPPPRGGVRHSVHSRVSKPPPPPGTHGNESDSVSLSRRRSKTPPIPISISRMTEIQRPRQENHTATLARAKSADPPSARRFTTFAAIGTFGRKFTQFARRIVSSDAQDENAEQAPLTGVFGRPPNHLPGVKYPVYFAKIPVVLVDLKQKLKDTNGYASVGIFRVAANQSAAASFRTLIDDGDDYMAQDVDTNIVANNIKLWFRQLPDALLSSLEPDVIEQTQSVADLVAVVPMIAEPFQSILLWLWDLCCEISENESINKMTTENLAIVFSPNLYNPDAIENPMRAMTLSQKYVNFCKAGIEWRKQTGDYQIARDALPICVEPLSNIVEGDGV